MNTKYISSSELKTSEFSRDEIYLVFTEKKEKIFFLFYTIHGHFPIHKAGGENAKKKKKKKIFENTNNFGTTLFLTF